MLPAEICIWLWVQFKRTFKKGLFLVSHLSKVILLNCTQTYNNGYNKGGYKQDQALFIFCRVTTEMQETDWHKENTIRNHNFNTSQPVTDRVGTSFIPKRLRGDAAFSN